MIKKKDSLWYKDAIIYELHVKAFCDSNGDGMGDFRGLRQKLDYLQDLGITAIWLLPFYPSPLRDDGYDIADYRGIHPDYGTLRDFRAFVREAHQRDMKVIIELVVNHTSDQHGWFQAARRAKAGSARRNFYVWSDTDTKFAETRIIFTDSESSNWAWDPVAGAYYWHRFFSHQPDLNLNNPRVVEAVCRVMRFWFDMGVDGMRLDAVPYLCVREGTNNENLPETHEVLKEFRRQLDRHYDNRMFLAEANQWPEDVRAYFGDGDECHMAFHFPLMPRIFMAIHQEDRHPITEILKRTPAIPDSCQWALFLRNHDELTLEMVTNEERDYMYREYAMDARMRVNVGIRRRLAPLVNNSMRRIELLNSLLFSFPGTPVLYYGDEIGMGDNIYLGDRNGVRTPMQWSADRNAGFSKADQARLYLPVIMDPVYSYQGLNVESQERNPSSLLHFMKRLISLRRQYKAFGKGSIEFLAPENRAVLPYIRRYQGEVILAVANLSRFVQPVELDLSEFRGWIPVELIGRTDFPMIGDLPYFLTMGPHSFMWFKLEPQAKPIRVPGGARDAEISLPSLNLAGGWDDFMRQEYRYQLEQDVLLTYLPQQRWFRGKAGVISALRITDWTKLGAGFFVIFVSVTYEDGGNEVYSLPLKIAKGQLVDTLLDEIPESLLCRVSTSREKGVLFDALSDRTACCDLFTIMADGRSFSTAARGRLIAYRSEAFQKEKEREAECSEVRRMAVEQSNTSIILDDTFILKSFRRVEEGPSPDMEIGRYLTESTSFANMAPVLGAIDYQQPDGPRSTVAMLQVFEKNQGDGWAFTMKHLASFLQDRQIFSLSLGGQRANDTAALLKLAEQAPPAALEERCGGYLTAIEQLGTRTAEFHLALSREKRNRNFTPEPITPEYLAALADAFTTQAQLSLNLLANRSASLSEELKAQADAVLGAGPTLLQRFQSLPELSGIGGKLIRCHGDYHLGQVLRTEDDFLLIDFEGEPIRSLAVRRRKQSPLKDVAGMLRSFSYAAHTALIAAGKFAAVDPAAVEQQAHIWEAWVAATFLTAYLKTAEGGTFLPTGPARSVLLDAFLLDKAFYELQYEFNNRPDWLHIPLAGIIGFIENPHHGTLKE
ncbi:MAG: maltose alpha-D-glucosyltransferase [Desulfobulbaceae bacterium]|nr:maltose alpha-D-glucosyltransferase [Desulfobulbaceae bacterium]